MYEKYIKRILDIWLSLIILFLIFPVMLTLIALVRVDMGKPIFFVQKRVGKNEKVFNMCKFRTMNDKKDNKGNLLSDELRVTKLGKFLRGTSLDELPELFNILRGDISFVGPRPLIPEYLPYYTAEERKRHCVKGGLTVPEVLYDNITPTWDEQFLYEIKYTENISLLLDLQILIKTFSGLLKRKKANYGSYIRKSLIKERGRNENNINTST